VILKISDFISHILFNVLYKRFDSATAFMFHLFQICYICLTDTMQVSSSLSLCMVFVFHIVTLYTKFNFIKHSYSGF
jgi:intracellular septation protein A